MEPDVRLYWIFIAEKALSSGTTFSVAGPVEDDVELQLVDSTLLVLVEEAEELDDLIVLLEEELDDLAALLEAEVDFEVELVVTAEELEELERTLEEEVVELGPFRARYAPTPATTTITTTIPAIAAGAIPLLLKIIAGVCRKSI